MTHNSIGVAHHRSGDIHNALCSYQQALNIQLATQSSDKSELATIHGNIANTYWQAGDLTEAINYYTKQLELETDANAKRQIEEEIEKIRQSLN
jgi:tetratricopeptide (TPR) repeat protein